MERLWSINTQPWLVFSPPICCSANLGCTQPVFEALRITKFSGKNMVYKKVYSCASVKEVQDAVVDLCSLSKTCKIYRSYFSSFSDMASRPGNTQSVIVKKHSC